MTIHEQARAAIALAWDATLDARDEADDLGLDTVASLLEHALDAISDVQAELGDLEKKAALR